MKTHHDKILQPALNSVSVVPSRFTSAHALALAALTFYLTASQIATAGSFTNTGPLTSAHWSHTATVLLNGKVLVAGGGVDPSITEIYDAATGAWIGTGPLNSPRTRHTATLLPNGKVLVVGGYYGSNYLSSAELYDPASGSWTPAGSMIFKRQDHTATLLPNGKVLIAGGYNGVALATAELYDPATGVWSYDSSIANTARSGHTATLLPNGQVLIAGGDNSSLGALSDAEIYHPDDGSWTRTGYLIGARAYHTATLLPNGKVLAVGGANNTIAWLTSAEVYDPAAGTWAAANPLAIGRYFHTAALLPNGKLLVAGGLGSNFVSLASAEQYDPVSGTWTTSGVGTLITARGYHTTSLLPNGELLAAGGYGNTYVTSAELYNIDNGSWTAAAAMRIQNDSLTATLLPNGSVLAAGGSGPTNGAELYLPATGTWTNTGSMNGARYRHTATLLATGKVLVAGGDVDFPPYSLASTELYDLTNGTWTTSGLMNTRRDYHTATLLPSGRVLVAGGRFDGDHTTNSAELHDPPTGNWVLTGTLNIGRAAHTATLLPDGKVLVAGGIGDTGQTFAAAELYDPATGNWSPTGPLNFGRNGHTATLLPNGKVLVAGGVNYTTNFSSAELYDPASGTWAMTGSMTTPRDSHSATLLPNGRVLVAGSESGAAVVTAELYDPASGSWTVTGSMTGYHLNNHTATLLPNGKVFVAGGSTLIPPFTTDLYDVGLGFSPAWQPQIATITPPLSSGASLLLTGSGFRGISEASGGGNASQNSSSDYPVVQLRSIEGGQVLFLLCTNWQTNSFVSAPVSGLPGGYVLATVFVNGIPSASSILSMVPPVAPPIIVTQPQGLTVAAGQDAVFTVSALGSAPLSYQWRFNSNNISGATNSTYTRTDAQTTDAGAYSVVITNSAGSATSGNATLTVTPPPVLAQWNFNSPVPDTNTTTGTTAPSLGSGTASLVGGTTQTFATGSANDPASSGFDNSGWDTASYPPQGTGNKTAGVQFNVSTLGRRNISIRWDQRQSDTASKYVRLQYTSNGVDFVDFPIATVINASKTFEAETNDLTATLSINNNSNFAFRIVSEFESTATNTANAIYVPAKGSSTYDTNGTIRFDMVTVSGIRTHFTLSLATTGSGTISKNPDLALYPANSTVTLTAIPSPNWSFGGWSDPGDPNYNATNNPLSVTMTTDRAITANFYQLTLTVPPSSLGTVIKNPDLSGYALNSTVTLTAVPILGYAFTGWSGDATGTQNPLAVTMTSSKVVTANFASATPDLIVDNTNATFTGSWGTSSGNGCFAQDYRVATSVSASSSTATFRPNLPLTGAYDVYVWYPAPNPSASRCTDAQYVVSSIGGTNTVHVDQRFGPASTWVLITSGQKFSQGTEGFVQLSDQSTDTGKFVMADAVRWAWSSNQVITPFIPKVTKTVNDTTLTWLSTSNHVYRLEYKTNLTDPVWLDLSGDVLAASNTASKTDSTTGHAASRFYRVELLQ